MQQLSNATRIYTCARPTDGGRGRGLTRRRISADARARLNAVFIIWVRPAPRPLPVLTSLVQGFIVRPALPSPRLAFA